MSIKTIGKLISLNKPIVWTLHDMWPFTGGCHYPYECSNFTRNCGNCRLLKSPNTNDLSNKLLEKKRLIYNNKNLHIVSVSNWLKDKAQSSSLLKNQNHVVIHNAINTEFFHHTDKADVKRKLYLDPTKKYLLFVAHKIEDPIKGFNFFLDALNILKKKNWNSTNEYEILLVGNIKENKKELLASIPYNCKHLGYASYELLPLIYSCAEISIIPSRYETFGQTISEYMACNTPVVAFDHSGPKDIVDHGTNGYLAKYKSAEDIANGIDWIISNPNFEKLRTNARKKITNSFTEDIISNKYIDLYKSLI